MNIMETLVKMSRRDRLVRPRPATPSGVCLKASRLGAVLCGRLLIALEFSRIRAQVSCLCLTSRCACPEVTLSLVPTLQVVCTIHQPNSDITDHFDDFLLLSTGRIVYFGRWNQSGRLF